MMLSSDLFTIHWPTNITCRLLLANKEPLCRNETTLQARCRRHQPNPSQKATTSSPSRIDPEPRPQRASLNVNMKISPLASKYFTSTSSALCFPRFVCTRWWFIALGQHFTLHFIKRKFVCPRVHKDVASAHSVEPHVGADGSAL